MANYHLALTQLSPAESELELEDEGHTPDTVKRHCTDCGCLLVFLLGQVALLATVAYAIQKGDIYRELAFMDDQGACGYRLNAGEYYLYFCQNDDSDNASAGDNASVETNATVLDTRNAAVCVAYCPNSTDTVTKCGTNRTRQNYPTTNFAGMLCMPRDTKLRNEVKAWFTRHREAKFVFKIKTVLASWRVLLASVLSIVLFSILYVVFLHTCARVLVYSIYGILSGVPTSLGVYFLYLWRAGRSPGSHIPGVPGGLLPWQQLTLGTVSLCVGLTFLCALCTKSEAIDLAIDCLVASCECLMETGSLRAVAVTALIARLFVVVGMGAGFLLLLSTGVQDGDDIMLQDRKLHTLTRVLFNPMQLALIVLFVAMAFWSLMVSSAFTDFVTIYITELWYFHGGMGDGAESGAPSCAICMAYCAAFRYHFGTLALAGLLIGALKPLKIPFAIVHSATEDRSGPVSLVLSLCCCCVNDFYKRCLKPIGKKAYMDVAMSSSPFWEASANAIAHARQEDDAVKILDGVTSLFQGCGLAAMALLGYAIALLAVKNLEAYSSMDSPKFVYNPEMVATVAAFLSVLTGRPLLHILDTVSDTIIYCYTVKKLRKKGSYNDRLSCGNYCSFMPCVRWSRQTPQRHVDEWLDNKSAGEDAYFIPVDRTTTSDGKGGSHPGSARSMKRPRPTAG